MLMPAAVLVLLVLGAITFDYAHLYLEKQDLQATAESAANDAVTFGVDQAALRRGEGVHLDPDAVVRSVEASLAVHATGLHLVAPPQVDMPDPTTVRVTLTGRVDYVFVPAVPGASHSAVVHASASATVVG